MNIPIDGIQAFVRIASLGSFRRAAEALNVSQTALSRRIQTLEGFVGVRLLNRTTRSTGLTPAGQDFLPLATRLVEDLTTGLHRLRTTSRLEMGDVTLATLQSVALHQLPAALHAYAASHPHNRVQVLERTGSLVTQAVLDGHAAFGIHVRSGTHPDLVEEVLRDDPFVVVCARTHPLAERPDAEALRWSGLAGLDLITLGGASGNRRPVEAQLERSGLATKGRFTVESVASALALARTGTGVAILPSASATIGDPALCELRLEEPILSRTLSLVRRANETLMPAAHALYRIVHTHLVAEGATPQRERPRS